MTKNKLIPGASLELSIVSVPDTGQRVIALTVSAFDASGKKEQGSAIGLSAQEAIDLASGLMKLAHEVSQHGAASFN